MPDEVFVTFPELPDYSKVLPETSTGHAAPESVSEGGSTESEPRRVAPVVNKRMVFFEASGNRHHETGQASGARRPPRPYVYAGGTGR
jgi:hypothetical protein